MSGRIRDVENLGESAKPQKLLVLFDSDCGFCSRSVRIALGAWFRADCCARAFQSVDLSIHNLAVDKCAESLHCVAPDGTISVGHEAVAAILRRSRRPWPLVGRLILLPGISRLAAWAYGVVAKNRHRLPGGTQECRLPDAL
ncbi:thiol-disulfide oxidoreductase DCC family protein [Tessaracoccus caeni]|uniref:thiol-disulfide oxidoreductase DCC family protein n=1 Tax=Tessaracoccus caeni TaxID=3031239 RepID=UPI0023DB55E7|nr:DUF393 domain-containing protein [Tessaracoccus caeni]MDF1487516.1 DUF393 domain-containing protein [Tessaracoccus caeni]